MLDPSGMGVGTTVHLLSEANQYRADLEADKQGKVDAARLPYGFTGLMQVRRGAARGVELAAVGVQL